MHIRSWLINGSDSFIGLSITSLQSQLHKCKSDISQRDQRIKQLNSMIMRSEAACADIKQECAAWKQRNSILNAELALVKDQLVAFEKPSDSLSQIKAKLEKEVKINQELKSHLKSEFQGHKAALKQITELQTEKNVLKLELKQTKDEVFLGSLYCRLRST